MSAALYAQSGINGPHPVFRLPPLRTSSHDCDGLRATQSRMSASGFRSSAIPLCGSVSPHFLRSKKTKQIQGFALVGCGPRRARPAPFCLHFAPLSPKLWTAVPKVRILKPLICSVFSRRAPAYFSSARWSGDSPRKTSRSPFWGGSIVRFTGQARVTVCPPRQPVPTEKRRRRSAALIWCRPAAC
jgi:hypothetical protein